MPTGESDRVVTATVLFVDLAGSTAQRVALGDDAADHLTAACDRLSRHAVAARGGRVVKGLGDGVMAVFSSSSDAVGAAVAIQQAAEQHNRDVDAALRLTIRIGCSAGDVQLVDGDCLGTPVVEAARLEAVSTAGEIWVSDLVRSLAGSRGAYAFERIGALDLKGLSEPVTAYRVPWDPLAEPDEGDDGPRAAPGRVAWDVPLPHRLERRGVFVGRAIESEVLEGALRSVESEGRRRVVLLGGEPGIGKTALSAELAGAARREGGVVLYGRCDEDLGIPYQPWVEALAHLVRHAPESVLSAHVGARGGVLLRLVPELGNRVEVVAPPSVGDPETERSLVFGAVVDLLERVSDAMPIVLVLDDVHWADAPSFQLLHHVIGAEVALRLLVVATYRDTDVADTGPLAATLASLRREPGIERIAVVGLDDGGVVDLIEAMAGHETGDDGMELAELVGRETGGNPFFAAEVLRHLAETGAIRQEGGRWVAQVDFSSIGLPESVREVVDQRVRRLGDVAHRTLTVASVIGRDFDLGLLAQAAERDEDEALETLEAAGAAGLVSEVPGRSERFTFTHALIQHTLYDGLSASRRARAHGRIGELLEAAWGVDPGDRIGELASHWVSAGAAGDSGKAAEYAQRAGEHAIGALAPDEAIRWFRRSLELLDADPTADPQVRLDAVIGLGEAQCQAGDPAFRQTLLDAGAEATLLGDTDRLVRAVLANQRGGWASNTGVADDERIAMLERALAALAEDDSEERALLLATLASELTFRLHGEFERRRALAAEAEAMVRRLEDDTALLRVLNKTFVPLWVPDGFERSVAASGEALALAERSGSPLEHFRAALNRLFAMGSAADRVGIDAALALTVALAAEIGLPYVQWLATYAQSWRVLLGGDADEAERWATDALTLGSDSGQPDALTVFGANLLGIRWHQGRTDEMVPLLEESVAANPGVPAFLAVYAQTLCESGDFAAAQPLLEAARAADFHNAMYDYIWLTNTTFWGNTAAWLGDVSAAAILYERLEPFEQQGVANGATFTGTVGMCLARLATVLGRERQADGLFERADAQVRALGAPFFVAANQLEWSNLLAARGTDTDLARAEELLADAIATAAAFGCAGVERRARDARAALSARESG